MDNKKIPDTTTTLVTNPNTNDFNSPLTREELATYYAALSNANLPVYEKLIDKLVGKIVSNEKTTRGMFDSLAIGFQNYQSATTVAINKLADSQLELAKSISKVDKLFENKTVVNTTATNTVTKPDALSTMFDSTATVTAKICWRNKANKTVRALAEQLNKDYQPMYNEIYQDLWSRVGYSSDELYAEYNKHRTRKSYVPKIGLVTESDVLRNLFDTITGEKAIEAVMKARDNKGGINSIRYASTEVLKCPQEIKDLCCKVSVTGKYNARAISKLYKIYNVDNRMARTLDNARCLTGRKAINRGYAIMMNRDDYNFLIQRVNEYLTNSERRS